MRLLFSTTFLFFKNEVLGFDEDDDDDEEIEKYEKQLQKFQSRGFKDELASDIEEEEEGDGKI